MKKYYLLWVFSCLFLSACTVSGNHPSTKILSTQDIIGTWYITLIDNKPTLEHSQTELTFSADNRLSGKASCNRITTSYLLSPEKSKTKLTFNLAAGTRMMCPHILMAQEQRFFDAMAKVTQVRLEQGNLILFNDNGMLLFKAYRVSTHD